VKRWRLLILCSCLGACVADSSSDGNTRSESVTTIQEGLSARRPHDVPAGKGGPIEVTPRTRTPDPEIMQRLPKREVYELPVCKRQNPVLAIPKDGRGVPLLLDLYDCLYNGDVYFTRILRSGYLSLLDLQIILRELRKPLPRWSSAIDTSSDRTVD